MEIFGSTPRWRDGLVVTLLLCETRFALRSMPRSDAAWIGLGGGILAMYGAADVVAAVLTRADRLVGQVMI